MELCLVALTAHLASRIEVEPGLLDQIFLRVGSVPESGDEEVVEARESCLVEDYRRILSKIEQQEYPWLYQAINGTGRVVDYEFGYGRGFLLLPQEVVEIASGIATEGWLQDVPNIYPQQQVARYFTRAADRGYSIIGGVG
ncbi:hypothetical protein Adu01nite_94940 [Paractinoplanes durhamensis]|uniref:Uncharacterized protein n=1 Tax=Paractinoplanes durhamensis TaxID=113563 RepID=A0ABQ3ZF30_9ACTN|nr:hypothetical protein Adu01nite_94940 [Actinoplanes durhamensis]